MTRNEFVAKQLHLSVTAGMNQRYHQARAHFWTNTNRAIQFTVGVLAVIALCLAVVAGTVDSGWADAFAIFVSALAAIAAIGMNVIPVGDWAQSHVDFLRRWSDLREDVDGLLFGLGDKPTPESVERLKQLDAKVHRICGSEPQGDNEFIGKCYADEKESRRPDPMPCG